MPGRVLIIDDDGDFREAIGTLLEAKGYEVLMAADGEGGLARALETRPDLILLDVMMSHKTEGLEIARRIQNESSLKGTPVIMTTGIRKDMNLPFGLEADEDILPVKAVLEKPLKPLTLLSAVEENIRKR